MRSTNQHIVTAVQALNDALYHLDNADLAIDFGVASNKSTGYKSFFHQKQWTEAFAEKARISKVKTSIRNIKHRLEHNEA